MLSRWTRCSKGKATEYNDQLSDHRLSKPLKTEIKPFEERISIIRLKGKQKLLQRNKEVLGVDGHWSDVTD